MGYRLEWKPGDYIYESPEHYAKDICKASARTWGLYTEPQEGCDQAIEVYYGRHWVQPKNVHGKCLDGFTALYLGPILHQPPIDEDIIFAFPSIVEDLLRTSKPELFKE